MKTIKILSALSLVVIFAASSLFASLKPMVNSSKPEPPRWVTYVVDVKAIPNFPGKSGDYLISITDDKGKVVAHPQLLEQDVWQYTFKELGSFTGIRIAKMEPYPPEKTGWIINPYVIKGKFTGGNTYHYFLIPIEIQEISPGFVAP